MQSSARNTQVGYARDIAAFLTFLWSSRGKRWWKDAAESDHLAYAFWRRSDPDGPSVAASTWDREVAAVNRFYQWAVRIGYLAASPIPQTTRRPAPVSAGLQGRRSQDEQRPATYSHGARRHRIEWLAPAEYRRWRDVGVRGFGEQDLLNPWFRGRWSARNAVFCDLMVRTGLRLSEQSALTAFDIPKGVANGGYQRFWLPARAAARARIGRSRQGSRQMPRTTTPGRCRSGYPPMSESTRDGRRPHRWRPPGRPG
jgi:integrase